MKKARSFGLVPSRKRSTDEFDDAVLHEWGHQVLGNYYPGHSPDPRSRMFDQWRKGQIWTAEDIKGINERLRPASQAQVSKRQSRLTRPDVLLRLSLAEALLRLHRKPVRATPFNAPSCWPRVSTLPRRGLPSFPPCLGFISLWNPKRAVPWRAYPPKHAVSCTTIPHPSSPLPIASRLRP